jgi:hypothetical protein
MAGEEPAQVHVQAVRKSSSKLHKAVRQCYDD